MKNTGLASSCSLASLAFPRDNQGIGLGYSAPATSSQDAYSDQMAGYKTLSVLPEVSAHLPAPT